MSTPIVIEPEAERDLTGAWDWYELARRGLGDDFLLCFEAICATIAERPRSFPRVARDARRALMNRFPYLVLFVEFPDRISVIGVFHTARNPKLWRKRARRK